MKQKNIAIYCGGDLVSIVDLKPLQGNLKTLKKDEYEKLRKSLINKGITFPVFLWKEGDTNWIIDGHQRVSTLQKLIAEGYGVPAKIPAVFVKATNKDHAKELVLLASSTYAKVNEDGLSEFIEGFEEIDWEELKAQIDLPDFNMEDFQDGFVADPADAPEGDAEGDEPPASPTHVKLQLQIHNEDYTSFMNQLDELLKKFPRVTAKGDKEDGK